MGYIHIYTSLATSMAAMVANNKILLIKELIITIIIKERTCYIYVFLYYISILI